MAMTPAPDRTLRRPWPALALLPLLLACSLVTTGTPSLPAPQPTAASLGPVPTAPPVGPLPTLPPTTAPTGAAPYIDVNGAGYQGVIVPADRGAEFGIFKATGYWTATENDVAAFEAAFPGWIAQQTEWGAPEVTAKLPEYIRQYVGFSRGDTTLLYVNAFCELDFIDWHKEPVSVDDGGPCFFRVVFDPADGTFLELMINGLA